MPGKYEDCVRKVRIEDRVGNLAKWALMDGAFFGWDSISIRYGLVDGPGVIPEETGKLHTHDYDQILWFVSSDPNDMLELGAELEVTLGTNGNRHRVTIPSVMVIPAGTPHFSPMVRTVDRPFYFLSVNCTAELKAEVADENAVQGVGPWSEWGGEYNMNVSSLHFARKGAYHYGSAMDTDSGGIYAHVNSASTHIPLSMTWQTVTKPHTLGPRKNMGFYPHAHADYDETLIFLSLDQENLTDLHGEANFSFGQKPEERETYTVSEASAMVLHKGDYHLPLTFTRVDRPMIFISLSNH